MTTADGIVVVGASQAGVQLASSLRELGYDEPITLIGAEPELPYQRPPLSKAALAAEAGPESLQLRGADWFAAQRIDLRLGERVVAVDRSSGEVVAASGLRLPFGRLALTTGARPRTLSIPGAGLGGVFGLRDVADAKAVRTRLDLAEEIVVVGGGFIGLEVAATARKLGTKVTVVLLDDRLMARAVGEPTSALFREAHRRRGVELRFGVMPTEFVDDRNGEVGAVVLNDGTTLPAQGVVIGVGVEPCTELAQQLGLAVDNGIVVDEFGVASDGVTVAAGDCVSCPSPVAHVPGRVRLESVNTATEQARTAAASIVGAPRPYRSAPWFWSDQFDLKLQVAGLVAGHDQVVLRGDPATERCSALYYREGRLIAAECVNSARDFVAVRSALAAGHSAPPEAVVDPSVSLKSLLSATEVETAA